MIRSPSARACLTVLGAAVIGWLPAGLAAQQTPTTGTLSIARQGSFFVGVHGCCLTGKTWQTTPDGRMGWDEYFVRKAQAANAAGGAVDVVVLPDRGIHGNSHMMMQDKNNLQVADLLDGWIAQHVGHRP